MTTGKITFRREGNRNSDEIAKKNKNKNGMVLLMRLMKGRRKHTNLVSKLIQRIKQIKWAYDRFLFITVTIFNTSVEERTLNGAGIAIGKPSSYSELDYLYQIPPSKK